jgi:thiamine kinase-like enzyme
MKHKHKISIFSPLMLDPTLGLNLLRVLSGINKSGIYDFTIRGDKNTSGEYEYESEHINESKTLADYTYGSEDLNESVLDLAWTAVTETTFDLEQLAAVFSPDLLPKWTSIDKRFRNIFSDQNVFHCSGCQRIILNLLSIDWGDVRVSFCHGDLHSGNFIQVEDGFKIIDLENIHVAPRLTDFFIFSFVVPDAHNSLIKNIENYFEGEIILAEIGPALIHAFKIVFILQHATSQTLAEDISRYIHLTLEQVDAYI